MKIFYLFMLFSSILFADSLSSLLQKYKNTSEKSLKTVDEKLGHVIIYSQKEIRLMQYNKLSDILKELPLMNFNTNRYGLTSPSLAGTKTTTSGFFRFFINDHEISSAYSQSEALSWDDLPLDFIDHVEIYYGDSSFAKGNETGIYFIRMYTKSALKENANEIKLRGSNNGSNLQSVMQSQSFENGWSTLLFFNNEKSNATMDYEDQTLQNNSNRKYLYLDVSNENTNINIGYANIKKDNYMGLSFDVQPDGGEIESKDFFVDITQYFLEDKSIKLGLSFDINNLYNEEKNKEGIGLIPVLDLASLGTTIPKEYNTEAQLTKTNVYLSKSFQYKNNNFLTAINIKNKQYKTKHRTTVNFLNTKTDVGQYSDFDEETAYSFLFEDDYRVSKDLILIANAKVDKYNKKGYLEDSTEKLFRIGTIYTPFKNFGLKSFYTSTYIPISFYNTDLANKNSKNLKSQKYKIATFEGVYTHGESKFSVLYHNVKIHDFVYLTPVGFINVDHDIKTEGLTFNYEYHFSNTNKINLNYYAMRLSETINNSDKGGYIKYMGEYDKFSYFTSLLYKSSYDYLDIHVRSSFDLSLGVTYNFSKDLSASIKGSNLLNKSTKSLYTKGFPGDTFALEDHDRSIYFSLKWVF
ncbi:TonB-dependent receptor plug domain-containing protein [Sulfurospirillum arcachonense]|uniref:TonB-dependent receptor plug domain-containing protein n=1 Tax=Sulfurospirillum arcachonense TaxID=57666 RepID=UPI000467FD39|nr:TonB-dependent receptor plug domain-containing protein [Sulfurospirillum arcachonense]